MNPRFVPLLLAAGGIAALCALDAAFKHLLHAGHPVLMLTFLRYLTGSVVAAGVWSVSGRPRLTRAMWPGHLARGLTVVTTALLFFWSLTVLTLAEAITLSFVSPLLIPLMARVLLGERLRRRAMIAVAVGFGGVLIAVFGGGAGASGSFAGRELGLAAILAASVTYALTAVLMRFRGADGSVLLTLTGAAVPVALLLPLLPTIGAAPWQAIAHDVPAWPFVLFTGIIGNVGIQLLARAYARAEAQLLAPIEFTGLIWAAAFGWLFFGETVRPEMWAGGALIIAGGLWSARESKPPAADATPPRWVAP